MTPENREQLVAKPMTAERGIDTTILSPSLAARPRSIRRLQLVSLVLASMALTVWLSVNLLQGNLRDEFRSVEQWVPPVGAVTASLLMFAIARSRSLSSRWIVRAGLAYQVVISFCIVFGSSYNAYLGAAASDLVSDRVGLSWVIPWMLFFTVLVQAPVRETVIALLLSAAAPGLGFAVELAAGRAPPIPGSAFFVVFVLPNAMGVLMTWLAARIVHELGLDVQRAQELGSYRLESRLGQGGMGEVWRATHHTLARPAAIKLIRPDALDTDPAPARSPPCVSSARRR